MPFVETEEPNGIKTLHAKLAKEVFDKGIVRWFAEPQEVGRDAAPMILSVTAIWRLSDEHTELRRQ